MNSGEHPDILADWILANTTKLAQPSATGHAPFITTEQKNVVHNSASLRSQILESEGGQNQPDIKVFEPQDGHSHVELYHPVSTRSDTCYRTGLQEYQPGRAESRDEVSLGLSDLPTKGPDPHPRKNVDLAVPTANLSKDSQCGHPGRHKRPSSARSKSSEHSFGPESRAPSDIIFPSQPGNMVALESLQLMGLADQHSTSSSEICLLPEVDSGRYVPDLDRESGAPSHSVPATLGPVYGNMCLPVSSVLEPQTIAPGCGEPCEFDPTCHVMSTENVFPVIDVPAAAGPHSSARNTYFVH